MSGAAAVLTVLLALAMAVLTGTTPASAYWSASGSASATAATATLPAPVDVTVPGTAGVDVPVSWTPGEGPVQPAGYYVTRHTDESTNPACASSPTSLLDGTSCDDANAPDGEHTYVVTAVYASWTAPSAASATVTVTAPTLLEAAQSYSVLAATAVVNTGTTSVSGDLGVSPGNAITGIDPMAVGGDIHADDEHAAAAQAALADAHGNLAARPADAELVGDLGGRTLLPGVYHSTAAMAVTGTLVLDAQGDADAVFVLQSSAAFNTAAASRVDLIDGAQASNVFWVVAGAAGTGANSFLSGTILAQGAITLGASTELIGRALSLDTVTMASSTIRFTGALPPTIGIDGGSAAVTKDTTPTIGGTSSAAQSSAVTVIVDGQSLGTTVAVDGTWTVTAAELSAGRYEVVARVRDANGDGSAASQGLTVEVNPPAIDLGAAATYSVLAATGVVNTGATTMSGDLGVSPATSVTGFPPGTFDGALHAGDPAAAVAQEGLLAALDAASSRAPHTEIAGDLGGQVFHAGVHHRTAALALTGTVTLDGEGDQDAVFVFLTDAAFDTAAGSIVSLVDGAQPANVFWVADGATGTGANSSMSGALLSRGAITLGAGTTLTGQALSRDTVTMAGSSLTGVTLAPMPREETVVPDDADETAPPVEETAPPDEQSVPDEQDVSTPAPTGDEINDDATVTS
ncbi:ice-binding family protein [Promicromonospora sp. NPDC057138]|uniref:ice-binding family protein n=1 Tax=Promicromonospora sp. NPDC057138 TaxID=3346031 RepID=UPI003627CCAB